MESTKIDKNIQNLIKIMHFYCNYGLIWEILIQLGR